MKKKSSSKSLRKSPQKNAPAQSNPSPRPKSAIKPLLFIIVAALVLTTSVIAFRPKAQRVDRPAQQNRQTQPPMPAANLPQDAQLGTLERKRFIDSLQKSFMVEECCAAPLSECAAQNRCAIAPKLVNFVRWMDSLANINPNINNDRIADELQKRYASFTDTTTYAINPKGWPVTGDPKAPITIGMYYSGTCPVCKTNYRELHAAVTAGPLKGKAKIVAKPYTAGFVNRAIVAAQDMGRFSEYMLEMARRGGRADTAAVFETAATLLLNVEKFSKLIDDPGVLTRTEESTREGDVNGVKHVPTYFINGRRYESIVSPEWVADAVEYFYDRR